MKKYKILITKTGVLQEFGLRFLFVMVVMLIIVPILIKNFNWLIILFLFYINRLVFYSLIDFLCTKEIFCLNGQLYIKFFLLKLKIDKNRCFTIIEKTPAPSKYGSKQYYLVLIRNDKNKIYRIFKNKIKLYSEDGNINIVGVAKKISNLFEIEYKGIDKFRDGKSYDKNESILLKHTGYIP